MLLPKMKYKESAYQQEVIPFLGINYSDNFRSGELAQAKNLSDVRYPYLSPRNPRGKEEKTSPTAIFSWDGKLILVDGTTLYYDGEAVGTVSAGEKQFAVVNTKLCIWPDKAYLDLKTKEFGRLDATIQNAQGTKAVFTENSVQINGEFAKVTSRYLKVWQMNISNNGHLTKVYSSVSWTKEGGWVLEGEKEVEVETLAGQDEPTGKKLQVGDIVMLQKTSISGNYQMNTRTYSVELDETGKPVTYGEYTENNDQGYYAEVVEMDFENERDPDLNVYFYTEIVTLRVLNAQNQRQDLTELFETGDKVQISGCTVNPKNNTEEGKYLSVVSVSADTLTFADGTFTSGEETSTVTVKRPIPDMDYVCESENRLWGVSNQDKTVYASALGSPKDFYTFDGLATDAYAVAVGSEGDFSAICKYGNAVLCWKEHTLHKVLGSYPAEYQMVSYQYAGVKQGAYKSIVNINEVLFYLGADGVYAFSGGSPSMLSRNFGQIIFSAGVAGTDGNRYWLSYKSLVSQWSLVSYDPENGIWLREDDSHVLDFCRLGDNLLFLSGNTIYTMGTGTDMVEWMAQFTPFYETVTGRKRYSRLFLRVELPRGSWIKAEMRCDGGRWEECGKLIGGVSTVQVLPLLPNRCDRFEVRLNGYGPCAVQSMLREFRVGGAV